MLKSIPVKLVGSIVMLLFVCHVSVFAEVADTSIAKADYKLSRKEFYTKYAPADTVKQQIIDHYFYKRKDGLRKVSAFPVAFIFTGVMITTSLLTSNNELGDKGLVASATFYGAVFGAVGTLISIPISIGGLKTCKKYNRKQLAILLKEIESGKKNGQTVLNNFIRYELPDNDE